MIFYKIPIIEKIYEAYSAIADGRIKKQQDVYLIESSNYTKTYTILCENDTYISNDNMSYWNQTIGYPIIAVMMIEGKITYNKEVCEKFKNIDWKKINTEYKNDYVKAAAVVLENLKAAGEDIDLIKLETEKVYSQVQKLKLAYNKSKIKLA